MSNSGVLDTRIQCVDRESRWYQPGALMARINGRIVQFDTHEIPGITHPYRKLDPLIEQRSILVYVLPVEAVKTDLIWLPGDGAGDQAFRLNSGAAHELPAQSSVAAEDSPDRVIYRLGGSTLEFTPQSNGAIGFKMLIVSESGNTGEAEGLLQPASGVAVWKNEAFECELRFQWQPGSVKVEQQGECGFGMGVDGSGVYVR